VIVLGEFLIIIYLFFVGAPGFAPDCLELAVYGVPSGERFEKGESVAVYF
jgi:hypothetical protein